MKREIAVMLMAALLGCGTDKGTSPFAQTPDEWSPTGGPTAGRSPTGDQGRGAAVMERRSACSSVPT